MKIVEKINEDKEIQELKNKYKKMFGKNAPPFNYDEYEGIDGYKKALMKLTKKSALQ